MNSINYIRLIISRPFPKPSKEPTHYLPSPPTGSCITKRQPNLVLCLPISTSQAKYYPLSPGKYRIDFPNIPTSTRESTVNSLPQCPSTQVQEDK